MLLQLHPDTVSFCWLCPSSLPSGEQPLVHDGAGVMCCGAGGRKPAASGAAEADSLGERGALHFNQRSQ